MKSNKIGLTVAVGMALVSLCSPAAVRTFTAAVSKYWSNEANWQDNAKPTSGDTVVISAGFENGNYVYSYNDIDGLTLAGLTYTCPNTKTLISSGKKVILSEGAAIGSTTAVWVLLGMPIELAAGSHEMTLQNRLDTDGVGGTYGTISGAGSLTLSSGTFVCYCSATFTGGFTAKSGTSALVFANNSLGTGLATFEAKSLLKLQKACTLANDFNIVGRGDGSNDIIYYDSATFTGNVSLGAQVRTRAVAAGKTLTFKGTVSMPDTGSQLLISQNEKSGTIVFDCPVNCPVGQFWGQTATDNYIFNAAGNRFSLVRLTGGTATFAKDGASDPQGKLTEYNNSGAMFIVNGAQETKALYCTDASQGTAHSITSENGGTLKVNAVANAKFVGAMTGPLGFIWNPIGAYTFTATGDCTFSGALVVSNGTVAVSKAGSLANISALTVSSGATLSLSSGVTLNPTLDSLDISATGTLTLPEAVSFDVGKLYVDGVLQPDGVVYTGGVAGEGQVHLDALPANAVVSARIIPGIGTRHEWNGAGLSNDALDNDANWQGGVAPSFGQKCLMAVTGGSSATVSGTKVLNGVWVETGSAFALNGTGLLDLYWGGLSVVSTATGDLTINAPIRICGDQAWQATSGARIFCNSAISDDGEAHTLYKTGSGQLRFYSENTFTGDLVVSNGSVQAFHDEALGSPAEGRVVFHNTALNNAGALGVWLNDVRISRPLHFEGEGIYHDSVAVDNGHTLELAGPVTITGGARWFRTLANSTIVFSGGVFGDNMAVLDGCNFVLTNTPSALTASANSYFYAANCDFTVACSNNASAEVRLYNSSKLHLTADNAFTNRPILRAVGSRGVDLHGHDLDLKCIVGGLAISNPDATIESEMPATVTVNSGESKATLAFTGATSLRVAGGDSHLYGGTSTSTGSLECVNGALTLRSGAKWMKGKILCENSGAMIRVMEDSQFGRRTDVYVGKGGKLDLQSDVVCGNIYFYKDGKWVSQGVGTYGSTSSSAENKTDDYFVTGSTGVIRALRGGMLLIFK